MKSLRSAHIRAIRNQGPCRICGRGYAAHRMIDTQMDRTIAGEDIDAVAADYGHTTAEMVAHWGALVDVMMEDLDAP